MSDKNTVNDEKRWTEIKNVQDVDLNSSMRSSFKSILVNIFDKS